MPLNWWWFNIDAVHIQFLARFIFSVTTPACCHAYMGHTVGTWLPSVAANLASCTACTGMFLYGLL